MGIPEKPVCDCGGWSLDGPVEKKGKPDAASPASVAADGVVQPPTEA